ncbi:MAG: DUF6178 family protein [Nannocystaceae bacterium]
MADPSDTPDTIDIEDLRSLDDDPLILDTREDAPVLVPALPPTTFVRIARKLRDEDRLDLLLPHATPYQLSSLLDVDGWVRDRVDIRRARVWLHAIAKYATADRERGALADLMYAMDPELWTVALAAGTVVVLIDAEDDQARDDAMSQLGSLRTWETPDGFFVVGVPDDELGRRTLHTISLLYEDDLAEGRKLCMSIQSLLPAEAEETLLRFRDGRLADLGFVEWEQAMQLLRPLDHRTAAKHEALDFAHLGSIEGLEPMVKWRGSDLLRQVMMRLSPGDHGLRSREFLLLAAEMMSAQRFDPGDEKAQERSIDQTQATLALGLELLAREAPSGMKVDVFLAERVQAIGLRLVFRVGYGALHKVRQAAQLLVRSGRVSLRSPGSLLDRPWGPAIAALSGLFPELPRRDGKGSRPMARLSDVVVATDLVAQAGALARLCFEPDGYGVDPAWLDHLDAPEKVTLGDLVRTAIVHTHLPGSVHAFAPLTAEDLSWAAANLLQGQELAPSVGRELAERCADLGIGEHQQALAETILLRLRVELASLERDVDGTIELSRAGGVVTIGSVSMWLSLRHGEPSN